ncbi:MAG: pentapeptide repeat-containing protein [Gammaproteobacteria bacterium]|nr:pentapeptide repeat-containing protein [Gammaproteobacteria bacterium]
MPNEEHVAKLWEGVKVWNQWREENPDVRPDLERVDTISMPSLQGANLRHANLKAANLRSKNLDQADLREANLRDADLSKASLRRANLCRADLRKASFVEAHLVEADISHVRAGNVEFNKANLSRANLFESAMPHVDLFAADLREANLSGAYFTHSSLSHADFRGADLRRTNFSDANLLHSKFDGAILAGVRFDNAILSRAHLRGANLVRVSLSSADLSKADLQGADLRQALLYGANLSGTDLSQANLSDASLCEAVLVNTILDGAKLDGCHVYGISVWDISLDEGTSQRDLIITPHNQDKVTVDNLKVAQFIYLLLKNPEIRHVIDTISSKVVLILGRFTEKRKAVLDKLRGELRKRNFTPVLFDFDKPTSRDLSETILVLAGMARFVIADVTDAKSIPQELQKIVPQFPSLPVRPIILEGQYEFGMFKDFGGYQSVLPPFRYQDTGHLLSSLEMDVIGSALDKAKEIAERRKAFEQELAKG